MKITSRLLVPALISAASAASDASVYLFQERDRPSATNPPTLSPDEARLVFAQRLGVSRYHGIGDASENALVHINTFGGYQESLFQDSERKKAAELVLFVQGVSSKTAEPLLSAWSSITPAFTISNPPSPKSNLEFVEDLQRQVGQERACVLEDEIHPFSTCWNGEMSRAVYFDLSLSDHAITDLLSVQRRVIEFAKNSEMNAMIVLMPESGSSKASKPYGSYGMPPQSPIGRRQLEEPIASSAAFKSEQVMTLDTPEPLEPITGVPPVCHGSLDVCMNSTNNCSGHGECYKKYGSEKDKPLCYTCGCVPTEEEFLEGSKGRKAYRITYWGGAACQKKDVSGPFWLFAIFTVVMVGLISWSIGLLFSIGEEKLPGVIGAGVPSKSR